MGAKERPTTKQSQAEGKGAPASSHFSALYLARITNWWSRLQKRSPSRRATGVNTAKRAKGSPDRWNKPNQITTRLSSSVPSPFFAPWLQGASILTTTWTRTLWVQQSTPITFVLAKVFVCTTLTAQNYSTVRTSAHLNLHKHYWIQMRFFIKNLISYQCFTWNWLNQNQVIKETEEMYFYAKWYLSKGPSPFKFI